MRLAAALIVLCAGLLSCAESAVPSQEDQFVILSPDASTAVRGPWEFYWEQLLSPADFAASPAPDAVIQRAGAWNEIVANGRKVGPYGYATYRIFVDASAIEGTAALWIPHQLSSVRIFVNGEEKGGAGKVGRSALDSVPGRASTLVTFEPASGITQIVLHIANFTIFQGGMRGAMIAGPEVQVKRYVDRRRAFELLTAGLVLGAALYHLSFFFMHRTQKAFLFFGIVCLLIAARIPFHLTKSYEIIFDPLPWDIQTRIVFLLNTLSIPVGMLYIRSLFPDLLSRGTVFVYFLCSAAACFLQAGDLAMIAAANLTFTSVMLSVLTVHVLVVLYRAAKLRRSAVLMALGIVSLGVLSGVSLALNWRGEEGGQYALGSFFLFVLFQALALSRYFQRAVEAEAALNERLRESREALGRQREQLQVSLHDSLGGALTDLQVFTEQGLRSDSSARDTLSAIHDRVTGAVKMFRSQLLFMEDLELSSRDLLPGVQMTLLRRYADAGRELDFDATAEAVRLLGENQGLSGDAAVDLFFLAAELCTNDLKYGTGESFWRVGLDGRFLTVLQRNVMRYPAPVSRIPHSASERARKMGGTLFSEVKQNQFRIDLRLPLQRL